MYAVFLARLTKQVQHEHLPRYVESMYHSMGIHFCLLSGKVSVITK